MKKLISALVIASAIGGFATSASAESSLKAGLFGISIGIGNDSDMIGGRYMLSNDLAVGGSVGFGINGGDADGTDISFGIGARKYIKQATVSPFIGGRFGYTSTNGGDNKGFLFAAEFGAEAFLAKNFSVEGSIAFGYSSDEQCQQGGCGKVNRLGTQTFGASLNYYF